MRLETFETFSAGMAQAISCVEPSSRARLLTKLYKLVGLHHWKEHIKSGFRSDAPRYRNERIALKRAAGHVRNALKSLEKSTQYIPDYLQSLAELPDFYSTKRILNDWLSEIEYLEKLTAGFIHPDLRTESERKKASALPYAAQR